MKVVAFKASAGDLERWREAAWESRLTLSAWIRNRCNGVEIAPPAPRLLSAIDAVTPSNAICTRRGVARGSRCERCGKEHW
jgi:hypothetical protein